MAEANTRTTFPMFENILNQTTSLRSVAEHQLGAGRDVLVGCAALLRKSRRIVLSGMGASLFSSMPLIYWLAEDTALISVVETSELLHFLSPALNDGTTIILVSRSGDSVEVTKLLPILRERGIPVIGVVNVPDSTLAREADKVLLVNSPADELVAVQTYTGTVLVFAMLAAAIRDRLEETSRELEILLRALPGYLESCVGDQSIASFIGSAPIYFLGRGASLASVYESALLIHETAKAPAVGMSAAQFRHGPVEVVSHDFRVVIFGTQTKTWLLDYGLAVDLNRMGAEVRWIGPKIGDSQITCLSVWPEKIAEWCASVIETIPVQALAYRAAEAKKIRPGAFRFASPITLAESGFSAEVSP